MEKILIVIQIAFYIFCIVASLCFVIAGIRYFNANRNLSDLFAIQAAKCVEELKLTSEEINFIREKFKDGYALPDQCNIHIIESLENKHLVTLAIFTKYETNGSKIEIENACVLTKIGKAVGDALGPINH